MENKFGSAPINKIIYTTPLKDQDPTIQAAAVKVIQQNMKDSKVEITTQMIVKLLLDGSIMLQCKKDDDGILKVKIIEIE
jgi:hypothetical protein